MTDQPTSMTVCVALVTFNRKVLLLECLDALLAQTRAADKIFIIDNGSTDGTAALLEERGYLAHQSVELIREEKNSGGAGGFSLGIETGYKRGYDWIWLMDDDAEPELVALENALMAADRQDVVAIGNFKTSAAGQAQDGHMLLESGGPASRYEGTAEAHSMTFSSFVGLLVNKRAVREIGLPLCQFFLNHDDNEYCGRLRKVGKILLVPNSVIRHKEAARPAFLQRSFLGMQSNREPLKTVIFRYFEMRNKAWLYGREHGSLALFVYGVRRILVLSVAVLVFRDDHPETRINVIWRAHTDALVGRFDNEFPFLMLKNISRFT